MKHLVLLFCCGLLFSACVKNNPEPVWLTINEWSLSSNSNNLEEPLMLTDNLSEVWLYVDNKLIGVFELPCTIPVLASGDNIKVQMLPAIRNNGIASTKKAYPFVKPYEVTMSLVAGESYTFNPTTQYYDNVHFLTEDFTQAQFDITTDTGVSNAAITREANSDISMSPGNPYGHIHLTTSDSLWVGYSSEDQDLPGGGTEVYLEIDYMNTNSLLTGVLAIAQDGGVTQNPNILLNAQSATSMRWKKIYVDLKEIVSYYSSADAFRQYLRAKLDDGLSEGDVYIDNIHVVYF